LRILAFIGHLCSLFTHILCGPFVSGFEAAFPTLACFF
jgi:hypothetical protein